MDSYKHENVLNSRSAMLQGRTNVACGKQPVGHYCMLQHVSCLKYFFARLTPHKLDCAMLQNNPANIACWARRWQKILRDCDLGRATR